MGKPGTFDDDFFVFSEEFAIGADFTSFFIQGAAFANIDEENHIGVVVRVNALKCRNFRYPDFFANDIPTINFADKTQTAGQAGIQYN